MAEVEAVGVVGEEEEDVVSNYCQLYCSLIWSKLSFCQSTHTHYIDLFSNYKKLANLL